VQFGSLNYTSESTDKVYLSCRANSKKALDLVIPLLDITLTLHQHLAPRIIQCGGLCRKPTLITTFVLAGRKHSVALTRFFLLAGITSITVDHTHTLAASEGYVDGIAQLVTSTPTDSMACMLASIMEFVDFVKNLHLPSKH